MIELLKACNYSSFSVKNRLDVGIMLALVGVPASLDWVSNCSEEHIYEGYCSCFIPRLRYNNI